MKASLVLGRKIVEVRQTRVHQRGMPSAVDVSAIVLDNGATLFPFVSEFDGDYAVDFKLVSARRAARAALAKARGE